MEHSTPLNDDERALLAAARAAMHHAHAPYSRFAVGAAVRLVDGGIISGSNFENASYGLSLCAETVALANANAQGRLADVAAIAMAGGKIASEGTVGGQDVITPCGRCRQIIKEAEQMVGRPIAILCAGAEGERVERYSLDQLLPHAFGPANLDVTRGTERHKEES